MRACEKCRLFLTCCEPFKKLFCNYFMSNNGLQFESSEGDEQEDVECRKEENLQ